VTFSREKAIFLSKINNNMFLHFIEIHDEANHKILCQQKACDEVFILSTGGLRLQEKQITL